MRLHEILTSYPQKILVLFSIMFLFSNVHFFSGKFSEDQIKQSSIQILTNFILLFAIIFLVYCSREILFLRLNQLQNYTIIVFK